MYVVRVLHPEQGEVFKVFRARPDAVALFKAADIYTPERFNAVYLYEVSETDNPYAAVDAVKAGKAIIINRDEHADWAKLSLDEQLLKTAGLV